MAFTTDYLKQYIANNVKAWSTLLVSGCLMMDFELEPSMLKPSSWKRISKRVFDITKADQEPNYSDGGWALLE